MKIIGRTAFASSAIEKITLPVSLEVISSAAFERTNLSELNIPESVHFIGSYSLGSTLLEKVEFPDKVTVLRANTFARSKLSEFSIKPSVMEVNPACFRDIPLRKLIIADANEPLTFVYDVSDYSGGYNETDIKGNWFLRSAEAIEELYIGRELTVKMPQNDSISRADEPEIETNPFKDFTGIKKLTIGEAVTDATMIDLAGCKNLNTIEIKSSIPPAISQLSDEQKSTVTLIIPSGSVDAYESSPEWSGFTNIVQSSDSTSSIDSIETDGDTSPAEYYNLQGIRVMNPGHGIFIEKKGSSAKKVIL